MWLPLPDSVTRDLKVYVNYYYQRSAINAPTPGVQKEPQKHYEGVKREGHE